MRTAMTYAASLAVMTARTWRGPPSSTVSCARATGWRPRAASAVRHGTRHNRGPNMAGAPHGHGVLLLQELVEVRRNDPLVLKLFVRGRRLVLGRFVILQIGLHLLGGIGGLGAITHDQGVDLILAVHVHAKHLQAAHQTLGARLE